MFTGMKRMRSMLGVAGLLVAAASAGADQKADDLLKEVERATKSVGSLGADLQVTLTTQNLTARPSDARQPRQSDSGFALGNEPVSFTYSGTVKLKRPNLERIDLADPVHQTIAGDGSYVWTLLPTNEYIKNPADPQGRTPGAYGPVLMFFAPDTARTAGLLLSGPNGDPDNFATRYLGRERVVLSRDRGKQDGGAAAGSKESAQEFDVVEVRQLRPAPQAFKLYITADKLVARVVSETRKGGVSTTQEISLLNIRPNAKFDPAEFAFQLPPNARPFAIKPPPQRP